MELKLTQKKKIVFSTLTISISLLASLIACELILEFRQKWIVSSDNLDDGLFLYDDLLGWRLASNWHGSHKHYDFDVIYSTNPYGFRGSFRIQKEKSGTIYAFVGDSFTFSLGVNDDETFIELLNKSKPQEATYLNFGVPGYSSDQEYLLIHEHVFSFAPDVIILVIYLANDLLDNELPFPLQANRAKPYFELLPEGLNLKNVPVPFISTKQNQKNLEQVVLGDNVRGDSRITRYLERFTIFHFLKTNFFYKEPNLDQQFDDRFDYNLILFKAIIEKVKEECELRKINLKLILMPGKSLVVRPDSWSGQFQDYFRRKIVELSGRMNLDVIDLASLLRKRYEHQSGKWFYPNEGHLTAEGQKVVVDILAQFL